MRYVFYHSKCFFRTLNKQQAPVVAEEAVKETETTEAAAAVEDPSAVKFDEAAKTEEKPKKEKDLIKLGRRLSARFGAALSPKKEKKDPLAAAAAVEAPVVADAAPVLAPVSVEEAAVAAPAEVVRSISFLKRKTALILVLGCC